MKRKIINIGDKYYCVDDEQIYVVQYTHNDKALMVSPDDTKNSRSEIVSLDCLENDIRWLRYNKKLKKELIKEREKYLKGKIKQIEFEIKRLKEALECIEEENPTSNVLFHYDCYFEEFEMWKIIYTSSDKKRRWLQSMTKNQIEDFYSFVDYTNTYFANTKKDAVKLEIKSWVEQLKAVKTEIKNYQ